jgi:hypothetical protein
MRYILLSTALLTACNTMTPTDLKTIGTSHVAQTRNAPADAAQCISEHATRNTSLYAATVTPKAEMTQVLVRTQNTGWVDPGAAALFELTPAKDETVIRGWIHPQERHDHDAVFRGLVKDC